MQLKGFEPSTSSLPVPDTSRLVFPYFQHLRIVAIKTIVGSRWVQLSLFWPLQAQFWAHSRKGCRVMGKIIKFNKRRRGLTKRRAKDPSSRQVISQVEFKERRLQMRLDRFAAMIECCRACPVLEHCDGGPGGVKSLVDGSA